MVNKSMTKEARIYNEVKRVCSINGVGKIEHWYAGEKNETRLPYIIYKNKLKMN